MGVRQELTVALICISLMARDVGHRFLGLLAIGASSLEMSSFYVELFDFCWSNALFKE